MDELSTDDLRSTAFAANLRRAFGAPVEGDMPSPFDGLLKRLSEIQPPPSSRPRDPIRVGA
jgi:hypothetical protein